MPKSKLSINQRQDTPKKNVGIGQLTWNIPMTEDQWETQRCVYKLFYDDKFLIVKAGNTLSGSLFLIEKEYGHFVSHKHDQAVGSEKSSLYFMWHKLIKNNPGGTFRLEIVLETQDMYKLLMQEQRCLNESWGKDKNCMNRDATAYISKKVVTKGQLMAFRRYSKNL